MKYAKFHGNYVVEILEKDLKTLADNEVLIKVAFCGLCGSENRVFKNGYNFISGHEISGIIVDKGTTAKVEIGKKVVIYINQFCGKCKYCKNNLTNLCEASGGLLGWQRDGGYAEYVIVPESIVLELEDSIELDTGVLLLDLVGTPFHGIRLTNIDKNEVNNALVIGCGPIGLGAVSILKLNYKISNVYAADLSPFRLNLVKNLGAIPINVNDINLYEYFKEQNMANVDLIVEAVGSSSTIEQSMNLIRPRGEVVILGEPIGSITISRNEKWILKDFKLARSWYFPMSEVADNSRFLISNKNKLRELITNIYPLEKIGEAFNEFYKSNTGKVLIQP